MALVNVMNINVLDNPTVFINPFQFEITFEAKEALPDDLEWKATYVGSAPDRKFDQVLEEVLVGPIPKGVHKFVLQTASPDPTKIPKEDLLGVTVVLISCSYANQEFIRVGYYVSTGLPGAEESAETDPEAAAAAAAAAADAASQSPNTLERVIMADSPRVTRFLINWAPQAGAAGGGVDSSAAAAAEAEAGHWEEEEGDIGMDELGNGEGSDEEDDDDEDEVDLTTPGGADAQGGGVQGGW